jgi:hypothetical protein
MVTVAEEDFFFSEEIAAPALRDAKDFYVAVAVLSGSIVAWVQPGFHPGYDAE